MSKKLNAESEVENSDTAILAYILKILYGRDRDALAWRLIERFGSVSGIFGATFDELMKIDGMTDRAATFFSIMRPLHRQALLRSSPRAEMPDEHSAVTFAAIYFMSDDSARDACVYMDKRRKVICVERLTDENKCRDVLSGVCEHCADRIILIRFEPRGEDKTQMRRRRRLTELTEIVRSLRAIGVGLVDYIEYTPFKAFGLSRAIRGDGRMLDAALTSQSAYDENISEKDIAHYCEKSENGETDFAPN